MDGLWKKVANHKKLGPGGMNCVCCGPAPSWRKKWKKDGKKKIRRFVQKFLEE